MLGKGKTKDIKTMSFETIIKQGGNSGRIIIPKSLIGKKVKVTIQVLCLTVAVLVLAAIPLTAAQGKTSIERQQEIYAIIKADLQEDANKNMTIFAEILGFDVDPIEETKKIFEKETFEAVEYTPEQIHDEITNMLEKYTIKKR